MDHPSTSYPRESWSRPTLNTSFPVSSELSPASPWSHSHARNPLQPPPFNSDWDHLFLSNDSYNNSNTSHSLPGSYYQSHIPNINSASWSSLKSRPNKRWFLFYPPNPPILLTSLSLL